MFNRNERNLKLTIAYQGTRYHGFQRQNNALAIQQVLEEQLALLFKHPLSISGSGRTDTGVHAYGQVINFLTTSSIPVERIPQAARSVLPDDIVVQAAEEAPSDFHARRSAVSKKYIYKILRRPVADPFLRDFVWRIDRPLDVALMREAAQHVIGTHDFSAFRASGGAPVDPVRTIYAVDIAEQGDLVECLFWGNGFLYHMVRNLIGTLADVGLGRTSPAEFAAILASRDRRQAGLTAPPQGLYLKEVLY